MKPRRFALVLAVVMASAAESALGAPVCGQIDPLTKKQARAVLTLDEANTVNKAAFRRSFRAPRPRKDLNLVFNVGGCELLTAEPEPEIFVRPVKDQDTVPREALELTSADAEDGSKLSLALEVSRDKVDPGTYGGLVDARAPYLASNRTPITVSRTDEWWIPAVIGGVSGLAGLFWFFVLKVLARNKLRIRWLWLAPLAALAIGFGAVGAVNLYWDQEVWTADENAWATARAAFAGASTGALASVLATIWLAPAKESPGD
jgi:hypothetical protein